MNIVKCAEIDCAEKIICKRGATMPQYCDNHYKGVRVTICNENIHHDKIFERCLKNEWLFRCPDCGHYWIVGNEESEPCEHARKVFSKKEVQ